MGVSNYETAAGPEREREVQKDLMMRGFINYQHNAPLKGEGHTLCENLGEQIEKPPVRKTRCLVGEGGQTVLLW